MEEHLDVHFTDFQPYLMMIGQIEDVVLSDDPRSELPFTTYHVRVFQQRPSHSFVIDEVPFMGQHTGGGNESEDPLLKGDYVALAYFEGDPKRVVILGRYFNPLHESDVINTSATYPQVRHRRNGAEVLVDKNGNIKLDLAEGKSLVIRDSNQSTLLQITKNSGSYEIELGGNTGLKKLMTEDLIASLNALWTGVVPVPGDGGAAIKAAFVAALTNAFRDANSTTTTKAK